MLCRPKSPIGLGTLFFCAMLLDAILWILILARVEAVIIPQPFKSMADIRFDFPYSHGLLASLAWSILAGAIVHFRWHNIPAALATAAAVFSHFILDWLIHTPELPIAGPTSFKLGLGLWQDFPIAWTVESAIVLFGLLIYLKLNSPSRPKSIALILGMTLLTAITIIGQMSNSPPPSAQAMATTSLAAIALVTLFGWWAGKNSNRA